MLVRDGCHDGWADGSDITLHTAQQSCIRLAGAFGGLVNSEMGTMSRKTAAACPDKLLVLME